MGSCLSRRGPAIDAVEESVHADSNNVAATQDIHMVEEEEEGEAKHQQQDDDAACFLLIQREQWSGQREHSWLTSDADSDADSDTEPQPQPQHSPEECLVTMVNDMQQPCQRGQSPTPAPTLYLCWVDPCGCLHHHEPIHSRPFLRDMQDGSVGNARTHSSCAGHVFVFYVLPAAASSDSPASSVAAGLMGSRLEQEQGGHRHFERLEDIPTQCFVCLYRPLPTAAPAGAGGGGGPTEHILTASTSTSSSTTQQPQGGTAESRVIVRVQIVRPQSRSNEPGQGQEQEQAWALVDHSGLRYQPLPAPLCGGFRVMFQAGVGLDEWEQQQGQGQGQQQEEVFQYNSALAALSRDLAAVCALLPAAALGLLRASTGIFINKRLPYGRASSPEQGQACYHPANAAAWLRSKGLPTDHAACVEIFDSDDYLLSRRLWGEGGLLLHELCHAFHDQHVRGGYANGAIRGAYERAVRCGLYDRVLVKVHSTTATATVAEKEEEEEEQEKEQEAVGCSAAPARSPHTPSSSPAAHVHTVGPRRAYCTADCMEFFAELSTAWLCADGSQDFNKWGPFNRPQLQAADSQTALLLEGVWGGVEGRGGVD